MLELQNHQKEEFKLFELNMKWFHQNYDHLKEKYPDEYVVIYGEKVIDHGTDLHLLIEKLRAEYKDLGAFVIEFVNKDKITLLL